MTVVSQLRSPVHNPIAAPPFFPSPSSPNNPHPAPASEEFAHKNKRLKVVPSTDSAPGPSTRDKPQASGESKGRGEGKLAGRQRPISDPQGDKENHAINGIPQSADSPPLTPRSKHSSTPPSANGRASYLPFLSPDIMSTSAPLQAPSYDDITSRIPDSKRSSLISNRPAPQSPTPSRRTSKRVSHVLSPTAQTTSPPSRKRNSVFYMKIRDFAFPTTDTRHDRSQEIDINQPFRPPSPAPGGFLGPLSMEDPFGNSSSTQSMSAGDSASDSKKSGGESRTLVQVPTLLTEAYRIDAIGVGQGSAMQVDGPEDSSQVDSSADEYDDDGPFQRGVYKALFKFDPEGTAEMALEEDQEVKCLGRGGGVGWVVALKGMVKSEPTYALVPEGYLKFTRKFTNSEEEDAMRGLL
ncbi:hypothetical protein FRB99_004134 [Tulasnella sp. 403]|nr:hypothetical protein FRB99_004134 [Tulasnella sp. 403]